MVWNYSQLRLMRYIIMKELLNIILWENRTLLERARCILSQNGLSKMFWAEVIKITCYLVNRSLLIILELKTSSEVWSSSPIDYFKLRVFNCLFMIILREINLVENEEIYIFLCYTFKVKGYQL